MPRSRVPLKGPLKLIAGAALVFGGAYFGYQAYAWMTIDRMSFGSVRPGRVNLVAMDPKAGYSIIVSNGIAQLVEGASGAFEAPDDKQRMTETQKKRLPIREMLGALGGDLQDLSRFVMRLNDVDENKLPPVRVTWKAEDIRKALTSDADLAGELERALGVGLDGRPLSEVRLGAIQNGIVIDAPVPVQVPIEGRPHTLVARVPLAYKPNLTRSLEQRLEDREKVTEGDIIGLYRELGKEALGGARQDVRADLLARTSPASLASMARRPERVLTSATVVVSDQYIESAGYSPGEDARGRQYYNLTVRLTNDGKNRLWKHSRSHSGFALLLTVDGVAIAAPTIRHELPERDVLLTQLPDERLVSEAVKIIEQARKPGVQG